MGINLKLLHTADLHIGKTVHEFNLLEDQRHILKQIVRIAIEEEVQAVVVAGDVYDRSIPSGEAVMVLDEFLNELSAEQIPVLMISGNHDSAERLSFANRILRKKGIHISGGYEEKLQKVSFKDKYGTVNFYLLPFIKPQIVRYHTKDEEISTYEEGVKASLKGVCLNEQDRNILVTHHFVTNRGVEPIISDSEQTISVGGIHNIDVSLFEGFDYTALGHMHAPQRIGRKTVRYAGSPLKYSFSEVNHEKSVTIVELQEKGHISITKHELKPMHDMRKIKGRLKELLREDIYSQADVNDYIQVTLTDEGETYEPMQQLRAVYPNVMQLVTEKYTGEYENDYEPKSGKKERSVLEIFKEFYELATDGQEFNMERESAMIKILGILNGEEEA